MNILWHSPENNFTVSAQATVLYYDFENYTFEIIAPSPRGQRVNHTGTSEASIHTLIGLTHLA